MLPNGKRPHLAILISTGNSVSQRPAATIAGRVIDTRANFWVSLLVALRAVFECDCARLVRRRASVLTLLRTVLLLVEQRVVMFQPITRPNPAYVDVPMLPIQIHRLHRAF